MAGEPTYKLNIDTEPAVKNLLGLEDAAVEAENKVEQLDGQTVTIKAGDTIRAVEEVGRKLDEADDKARKAGSAGGGISTTTNAFKDLTEGIGGPSQGGTAVGALFGFGEAFEGLGDILEGFGGKLGLSEEQIGKLTSRLGAGLAILGGVGAAITIATAAFQAFGEGAKKARERQKEFDKQVEESAEGMRDLVRALEEGDRATAIRDILDDITPLLDDMARYGLDARDAILEIIGEGTPFTDKVRAMAGGVTELDGESLQMIETLKILDTEVRARRDGLERATEQDAIARDVLEQLNTKTDEATEAEKERADAIKETTEAEIDAIDTRRDFERSLDDVQQTLADYSTAIADAKGDTEKIEDATRDAADEVIQLAKDYGELDGAAVGTEEWAQRTTDALGYVAATLAPDSPLRRELLAYKAEIEAIPTLRSTTFTNTYPSPEERRAINQTPMGAVNITVNGALDANATARQIVNLLKDYRRRYGNLDLGF